MPKRKPDPSRKSARAPQEGGEQSDSAAPEAVLHPQRDGSSDMERALPHPVTSQETGKHRTGDEPSVAGFLEPRAPDAGESQDPPS
jgi:hypothetical protein